MEILAALIGAVIYALPTYWSKRSKGEEFQPRKFIRVVLIALIVGGIAYWRGDILTAENFEAYTIANTGIITVADQVIKGGYRLVAGLIAKYRG